MSLDGMWCNFGIDIEMIKTDNKKKIFILLCGITIIIMSDSLMTKLMTLIMHSMSSSRKNVMATPKNVLKGSLENDGI